MKRVAFLAAILVCVLAVPALAQDGGEFCALPEGCDLDGDGVAETPAGSPVPAGPDESQYGPEAEFCSLPEGCDASAPPDPSEEGSASPSPTAQSTAPEEGPGSAGASSPAEGSGASAGSAGVPTPSGEAGGEAGVSSIPGESAAGDEELASASALPGGSGQPEAGLTALPETGGVPAILPGLGVALVAGGMLVRRAFR